VNVSPQIFNFLPAAAVLLGLLVCFFGYRIFRFVLAIIGFVIGASFVAGFGYTLTDGKEIAVILIAAIAGGLIGAVLLLFLYSAGVFLMGAVFGILLFSGILVLIDISIAPFVYIVPVLLGGTAALLLQRFMIVLITSFTGAWAAVMGALYLLNSNFNPLEPEFMNSISDIQTYRIVFSWLALGILGFVTQYIIFPKKIKTSDAVEHSNEEKVSEANNRSKS